MLKWWMKTGLESIREWRTLWGCSQNATKHTIWGRQCLTLAFHCQRLVERPKRLEAEIGMKENCWEVKGGKPNSKTFGKVEVKECVCLSLVCGIEKKEKKERKKNREWCHYISGFGWIELIVCEVRDTLQEWSVKESFGSAWVVNRIDCSWTWSSAMNVLVCKIGRDRWGGIRIRFGVVWNGNIKCND